MAYFKVEDLFSKTLDIYMRNFVPIFIATLILNIPTYFLNDLKSTTPQLNAGTFIIMVSSIGYYMAQSSLLAGYIISRVSNHGLEQYKKKLEWPTIGTDWIVPLIIMFIVQTIFISIGLLCLLVPGIILILAWSYSTPVLILERKYTVSEVLRRSWHMTKGDRLHILIVFIILGLVSWIVSAVLNLGLVRIFEPDSIVFKLLSEGLNIAFIPIGSILIIVLYLGRRLAEQEGAVRHNS